MWRAYRLRADFWYWCEHRCPFGWWWVASQSYRRRKAAEDACVRRTGRNIYGERWG